MNTVTEYQDMVTTYMELRVAVIENCAVHTASERQTLTDGLRTTAMRDIEEAPAMDSKELELLTRSLKCAIETSKARKPLVVPESATDALWMMRFELEMGEE